MKSYLLPALALLFASAFFAVSTRAADPAASALPVRLTRSFDPGWRFLQADAPGAEQPGFNDSAWRELSVPHDWSIAGPFDEKNLTGGAGGYLPAGIGWYRKRFTLPAAAAGRRVFIEFDGVMANSDVWINGFHLGRRPYGYVSFGYELTGHLTFGGEANVLAVRVDDSAQPASRWYAGAGIYRHVRLVITDPVHFEKWGTFITTPEVSADRAVVHVRSTVVNQSDAPRTIALHLVLLGPDGRPVQTADTVPQTIAAGGSAEFNQDIPVANPVRWDLSRPALYRLLAEARSDQATLDATATPFGIRAFRFDAATGFWLNGRNLKLKGVCLHDDASALGMAVPLGAWARRLAALKALGVNAIRTAHNPPAPEFLDLCDRMGFLVMDELFDCWTVAKNPYDYHLYFDEWSKTDARDTVRRDRNHPSIVLYSAGNEIHDTPNAALSKRILAGLLAVFHENDPTRPVTQALLRPNVSHDYDDGLADMLDVIGTNYRYNELLAAHRANPARKIIGTENKHDLASWLAVRDNAAYAGEFIWSGIDYLGESHRWPVVAAGSGLLDRTGEPHPDGYIFQSWWSDQPMIYVARRVAPERHGPTDPGFFPLRRPKELFADWTPRDLAPHGETVEVYSNCAQVELFLNGQSLGAQTRDADLAPRVWHVPFAPGALTAVGTDAGRIVATAALRTAGPPARIQLSAERERLSPAWDDVDYVTATVVDARGVPVPEADNEVSFQIFGPAKIIAVDSADNASHEPFQASARRAYEGRCQAILRATAAAGSVTLTATAPGLGEGTITLAAVPPAASAQP